ncbi:lipase chaperone family protein [Shewanella vesiculosa]|uniref:lipase chaperone family protein n=1 Tax=Shewanella vesiculosa TaxID=518738 RepID=UPI003D0751B4
MKSGFSLAQNPRLWVGILLLALFIVLLTASLMHKHQAELLASDKLPTFESNSTLFTPETTVITAPIGKDTLGQPLRLSQALRWDFDDIILQHQDKATALENLLSTLASKLDLSDAAHAKLAALFQRYRDYKIAIASLKDASPAIDGDIDLTMTFDFIEQSHLLQQNYFSALEIDAFFARDNKYDQQAFERLKIRQDSSLTREQKAELLAHQISQLDEEERRAITPTLMANDISAYLEGTSPHSDLITGINADMSQEVLERVQATQKTNLDWQNKVTLYQNYQQQIAHLPDTEQQQALAQYQQQQFTPNEQKRLTVFVNHPELIKP